jgi:hypothetical protein
MSVDPTGVPMRACLDIPGDVEGGRVVVVSDWLHSQPLALDTIGAALIACAHNQTYRAPNGAWSLTPIP